jgi:uncharacterized membrane protein YeiB
MELITDTPRATRRLIGPDVVRAIAMAGVVIMNFHGYLINRGGERAGGWADDLFDPWTGPLSTRFAATFVLTAGVGVTLMTRSSLGDPSRTADMRWRLARRGLLLYGFGMAFDYIWPGTILPFYGAMFVLATVLFTLRTRWVVTVAVTAALAGWLIRWWRYERELDGGDTSWLTNPGSRSPRGLVFDVFVNGTHPLLPWLAFFCTGIALARAFERAWWLRAAIGGGLVLFALGTLLDGIGTSARGNIVLSNDPFERGLAYTMSALGTALIAFAGIWWLAERYSRSWLVDALRRAGQMSLSIYIAHALVFCLLVDWLDIVTPAGLGTSLLFATSYWLVSTAAAVEYHRRFGQGPVEYVYRRLGN